MPRDDSLQPGLRDAEPPAVAGGLSAQGPSLGDPDSVARQIPTYRDDGDDFQLSGGETLVAVGPPVERDEGAHRYRIQRFRPRVELDFVRVERWTRAQDGDNLRPQDRPKPIDYAVLEQGDGGWVFRRGKHYRPVGTSANAAGLPIGSFEDAARIFAFFRTTKVYRRSQL